ncbi:MAG: hypothetical protein QOF98_2969 [Streptomyces sp.]|nr:hypothetical protein [Streptomyces sp.]
MWGNREGSEGKGKLRLGAVASVAAALMVGAGVVPLTAGSAAAAVTAGSVPARHDFGNDGIGDVVTMDTAGRLSIVPGDGHGGVDSAHKVVATGWPAKSYPIPFGDLNGDGCNDLLIRNAVGGLYRYLGTCGQAITPDSPRIALGTGFNQYSTLTSPGDLDGDGLADLLARDTAGTMWMYPNDGTGLAPGSREATGQGGYTRIVGAGDLNGDGIGDVVAQDATGNLWRLLGNGKGGLNPRARIGTGLGSYNVIAVPGDLTGDGRPDLIGRDAAGRLFRWTGTANGLVTGRTQIATGWQSYLYVV